QYVDQESQKIISLKGEIVGKEKQAEMLIQSIADGIIVIDNKGDVTLINKRACEIVGWPKKEALGFDGVAVLNIMKDDKSLKSLEFVDHPFRKVLEDKKDYSATVEILNRDNTRHYVSLVISPVISPHHDNTIGAIAVLRDVSDEKKQEKQRAEFISTASHEMRTPVAAIEGYLALAMNEKVSSIDMKARDYLEKAHESTQHLGKLFQDLLTSAKAEDGRLTSHPTAIEMREFIEKLSQDLQFSAQKKGLEMELVINTPHSGTTDTTSASNLQSVNPVYYAMVDPDRIREVITNVFDNACKYTDTGKVSLGLTGDEKIIQIFVKDTGPGIPESDLNHLFQKFYRVDNSATRTIGGTGLGLFICQKIVELYGGRIWAESVLSEGSTFFINLPRLDYTQVQAVINQQDSSTGTSSQEVEKQNNVIQ
ncbi:MAG: PAS domain-containing sensor histidine kinase, partial [Patescibacteria group bacterium]